METDIFTLTIKGISMTGFEDIVIGVIVSYKNEEFEYQTPVKVPLFNSFGQKIIEQAAYEAYWKMKKHWGRLNELPPLVEETPEDYKEKIKAFQGLQDTENTFG